MERIEKDNPFYTDIAQRIIEKSKVEALRRGKSYPGAEHFLLALLEEADETGIARTCLAEAGVTLDAVRNLLPPIRTDENAEPDDDSDDEEIQLLPRYALFEMKSMKGTYIGAEHLLLALLLMDSEPCINIMRTLDVDAFFLRQEIIQRMKQGNPPSSEDLDEIFHEFKMTSNEIVLFNSDIPEELNEEEDFDWNDGDEEDDEEEEDYEDAEEDSDEEDDVIEESLFSSSRKPSRRKEDPLQFVLDLTELAKKKELDPVIGRQREIRRVLQILCCRTKNNAILLGEAGVGKTAIAEGIAQAIADGGVPILGECRVLALDKTALVAGTMYRGQFEQRMKRLLDALRNDRNTILFIDEIHTIVSAGNGENGLDISNILKPALARGQLRCIGATTLQEYHATIESDSALARRFQTVMVEPPTAEETLEILRNLIPSYEAHHHVKYPDSILQECIALSERYIPQRNLPDKAIEIIDAAGANVSLLGNPPEEGQPATVTLEALHEVIADISKIPVGRLKQQENERMLLMEEELQAAIVGQQEAIRSVCRALRRSRAELKAADRPIGSFLFLGTSGVGKTLLARSLAQQMFHGEKSLMQLDMSEFTEEISVSRLIGSSPGYVGYQEGGRLTEHVKHHPYSVVLFDEIEKAHPMVMDLLLQILENGKLTDGKGCTVSFANCIVILTSNAGTREAMEAKNAVGFGGKAASLPADELRETMLKQAKKLFRPEILSRLDEIIVFNRLSAEELTRVVELEIEKVRKRLAARGGTLVLEPQVLELVRKQSGEEENGARFFRRQVERLIEDPLAEAILKASPAGDFTASGALSGADSVVFTVEERNNDTK